MTVSIIVPMLNEEPWIEGLLENIAAQTFTGKLELLVADGGSTDRSVELLRLGAARHGLPLTLLENPERLIPHGLNACVRHARGELIVRMDCRARYPVDYLERCVAALDETGAWNVGGVPVSVGRTRMERAAACATDSPFGGIHWTRAAAAGGRVEVDTVYCGAFRREVFDRVGLFEESLPRNEDEDMNFRIRRAGGRILLDTEIEVRYTPKGSAAELFGRYHGYGRGKVDLMRKHRRPMTLRSLAPLGFAASLGVLACASVKSRRARQLARAELCLYSGCMLTFAVREIVRRRESLWLLPRVAAVFPLVHVGYGVGMLRGLASLARSAGTGR
jgi:succinoglycan biosynthesis protein ExoA